MTQPVFRFAPSPNGRLHLGHAYSAILNHDMAKACGGRFLLRIEDIDTVRCKAEFIDAALDDLHWLGLEWEEPVRRQSQHFADFDAALDTLKNKGLIYPAFLSRSEIAEAIKMNEAERTHWPCDPDGTPHYPGGERAWPEAQRKSAMELGKPYGWRLDMSKALERVTTSLFWEEASGMKPNALEADPARWGDVLLARKDVPTSYHLSVVVDDARQGITDVVRGRDLYQATAVHRLLQELLGLPAPRYFHHELVLDTTGAKLSKSAGSTSLAQLRGQGTLPGEVRREVRKMIGMPVKPTGSARP